MLVNNFLLPVIVIRYYSVHCLIFIQCFVYCSSHWSLCKNIQFWFWNVFQVFRSPQQHSSYDGQLLQHNGWVWQHKYWALRTRGAAWRTSAVTRTTRTTQWTTGRSRSGTGATCWPWQFTNMEWCLTLFKHQEAGGLGLVWKQEGLGRPFWILRTLLNYSACRRSNKVLVNTSAAAPLIPGKTGL
jgi:hypothetical protein